MVLEKILGLEKNLFIVIAAIFVILLLVIFYLYFASVFVSKKHVKVVERMGKETIALTTGWKIIVPIRDKVVAVVSTTDKLFSSSKDISVATNNNECYKLAYSLTYKVVDAVTFYSVTDTFLEALEVKANKSIINFYSSKDVKAAKDFYSLSSIELLKSLNEDVLSLGIEVKDVVLTKVEK